MIYGADYPFSFDTQFISCLPTLSLVNKHVYSVPLFFFFLGIWKLERVGNDYRCIDHYNPVDGDEVPVPHFGLALSIPQWKELASRLRRQNIRFIIEPTLRFKGQPGEQYTMFFKGKSSTVEDTGYHIATPEGERRVRR